MTGHQGSPTALDPPEAQALRAALVRSIAQQSPWPAGDEWDARVLRAVAQVPRHVFVPHASLDDAYMDAPYPIGRDQTISQPTVVALMTQALLLEGRERVLEIGTGSGYQAAVLAQLTQFVLTVERIHSLGEAARARLAALGFRNVHVRIGDGFEGWPEAAPFDRILLTAAPEGVPPVLLSQLAEGGLIVAPVGDTWDQRLMRWRRRGADLESEELGLVRFVPMLEGVA